MPRVLNTHLYAGIHHRCAFRYILPLPLPLLLLLLLFSHSRLGSLISDALTVSPHKPLPDPDRTPGSDLSSIGPSQSASQIYLPTSPLSVPPDQPTPCVICRLVTYLTNVPLLNNRTPPRAISPPPVPPRPSSPLSMPPASSFTLQIPPAHAISELALPSTLDGPINEESDDLEQGSSEEDSRHVEVVENARFATAATGANVGRRLSLRPPRARDVSGSNTTSSGTGTGTGSFSQPSSITVVPPHRSISLSGSERERKSSGGFFSSIAGLFRGGGHPGGSEKWKMRTETNLRAVRRDVDTSSEDEAHNESPTRRFFSRRTSHDTPRPSPPSPQKLRKRNVQGEKERDQGWISDGAAVRGPGARKGSTRKRSALPGTPSRPSHPSPSTSAHFRSSSAASMGWSAASTPGSLTPTPTRTKSDPKPKTDLRVEALSRSSVDVSRQSSFRSTGSAPRTPRRPNNTEERTAGLPALPARPGSGVGRKASLGHGKSASVPNASAHPHPDAGLAAPGQMSLMAIVEGVTKDNRNAWERASSGLPPAPAGSASKLDGLFSVRAPPPVTKYNLRGEGGQGIAFESVLAPGSVLATPPRPASASSAPQRPPSLPARPRVPMPATSPSSVPKVPLRSALRNHSPAPAPPPALPPRPIVIPSAPPRVIIESVTAPAQAPTFNGNNHDDDGSDSGSAQSFRTVRESFDEATPTPPAATITAPSSSSLVVPGQNDSDVSASSNSAADAGAGAGTRRRKSVRVSLQPTFSPSPPALDEDEDEVWKRSGRPEQHVLDDNDDQDCEHDKRNGKWKNGGDRDRERDFWVDSSEEDEEYSKARRMLTRARKKRW